MLLPSLVTLPPMFLVTLPPVPVALALGLSLFDARSVLLPLSSTSIADAIVSFYAIELLPLPFVVSTSATTVHSPLAIGLPACLRTSSPDAFLVVLAFDACDSLSIIVELDALSSLLLLLFRSDEGNNSRSVTLESSLSPSSQTQRRCNPPATYDRITTSFPI